MLSIHRVTLQAKRSAPSLRLGQVQAKTSNWVPPLEAISNRSSRPSKLNPQTSKHTSNNHNPLFSLRSSSPSSKRKREASLSSQLHRKESRLKVQDEAIKECTLTPFISITSIKVARVFSLTIVILTGDAGVGKSNFLLRYVSGTYESLPMTIGVEFAYKVAFLSNKTKVKAQIWDTCK